MKRKVLQCLIPHNYAKIVCFLLHCVREKWFSVSFNNFYLGIFESYTNNSTPEYLLVFVTCEIYLLFSVHLGLDQKIQKYLVCLWQSFGMVESFKQGKAAVELACSSHVHQLLSKLLANQYLTTLNLFNKLGVPLCVISLAAV